MLWFSHMLPKSELHLRLMLAWIDKVEDRTEINNGALVYSRCFKSSLPCSLPLHKRLHIKYLTPKAANDAQTLQIMTCWLNINTFNKPPLWHLVPVSLKSNTMCTQRLKTSEPVFARTSWSQTARCQRPASNREGMIQRWSASLPTSDRFVSAVVYLQHNMCLR